MPLSYVALDLETTGLNAERDAIIEMGAVRFTPGGPEECFTTLVRPAVDLPLRVTQITGLGAGDFKAAPPLEESLAALDAFVGDAVLVGHSVGFDLRFLHRHGLFHGRAALDTFELATVLLPGSPSFSLGGLCRQLGIAQEDAHRALPDAKAHRSLFEALLTVLEALEPATLRSIGRLVETSDWALAPLFREAAGRAAAADSDALFVAAPEPETPHPVPAVPSAGAPRPVDAAALEGLLRPAADENFPGYEDRPGQREMLRHVAAAFNLGDRVLVEAGTGVGKTLAYLLPAAAWAIANESRVVVSTHTIALQHQLVEKDLPLAGRLLAAGPAANGCSEPLRAVVLKGRAHYLCRSRLAALPQRTGLDATAVRAAAKILVWAPRTRTGDRAELALQPEEMALWRSVSAEDDACTPESCAYARRGECWVQRARRGAESAHVVVVNHALLLSDMLVDNRLLPEHDRLIVDEAHHLEEVATTSLGSSLSDGGARERLGALEGRHHDLVGRMRAALPADLADSDLQAALLQGAEEAAGMMRAARRHAKAVFEETFRFVREHDAGNTAQVRLTAAARSDPLWLATEDAWQSLDDSLAQLDPALVRLSAALGALTDELLDPGLAADLAAARREAQQMRRHLGGVVGRPGPNDVCWATSGGRDRVALHRAPLRVGDILARRLFHDQATVILTSATLRAGDDFDLLRERLGLPEAEGIVVGSPFDYGQHALLLLPADMPEPGEAGYGQELARAIISLAAAAQGRTLVLFTSHAELRDAYHRVRGPLGDLGVAVLGQELDGTRRNLLAGFRDPETRTVLMGTRSFWEGIDVPGEALSCLIIARLPFDVPTDPVFAARAETCEDPFGDYAVPSAVLRFRQGFGRLIRTASDRGVVVILDRRVQNRAYGEAFLDALPPVPRHRGPLSGLAAVARRFLAGEAVPTAWGPDMAGEAANWIHPMENEQ